MSVQTQAAGKKLLKGAAPFISKALTYSFQTIIDVGAGAGICSSELAKAGKTVVSYDLRPNEERDKLAKQFGFKSVSGDITDDLLQPDSFDAAWCNQVLEHVRDYGSFLDSISRVVKPNGYLFITVPAHNDSVVPGHTNMGWNVGMLMYNVAHAGFRTLAAKIEVNNVLLVADKLPGVDKDRGNSKRIKHYP